MEGSLTPIGADEFAKIRSKAGKPANNLDSLRNESSILKNELMRANKIINFLGKH